MHPDIIWGTKDDFSGEVASPLLHTSLLLAPTAPRALIESLNMPLSWCRRLRDITDLVLTLICRDVTGTRCRAVWLSIDKWVSAWGQMLSMQHETPASSSRRPRRRLITFVNVFTSSVSRINKNFAICLDWQVQDCADARVTPWHAELFSTIF